VKYCPDLREIMVCERNPCLFLTGDTGLTMIMSSGWKLIFPNLWAKTWGKEAKQPKLEILSEAAFNNVIEVCGDNVCLTKLNGI